MEIIGISHLGIATKNPQATKSFFQDVLCLPFLGEELVEAQKTNTYMFESSMQTTSQSAASARLEVLENQLGEQGPIAKFVEAKGGGIHHLALQVKNIEAAIKHMLSHNIQMIDSTPRDGAHNSRIAFVHPKSTGGILIELVEESTR